MGDRPAAEPELPGEVPAPQAEPGIRGDTPARRRAGPGIQGEVPARPAAAAGFYAERIELFRGGDKAAQAAALRSDTAAALHNTAVDVDAVTRERVEAVGDGAGYINAATAMASLSGNPLTPELEAITPQTPVTVIGAEHDTFCPRKAADIILGAIEHAEYREIAEAGHLMLIDQPERTVDVLRQCVEK